MSLYFYSGHHEGTLPKKTHAEGTHRGRVPPLSGTDSRILEGASLINHSLYLLCGHTSEKTPKNDVSPNKTGNSENITLLLLRSP